MSDHAGTARELVDGFTPTKPEQRLALAQIHATLAIHDVLASIAAEDERVVEAPADADMVDPLVTAVFGHDGSHRHIDRAGLVGERTHTHLVAGRVATHTHAALSGVAPAGGA